jgi:hypothetical protein
LHPSLSGSLIKDQLAWTNSPAEIIAAWPTRGHEIALAAGFNAQHAEAGFGVVEGDAVDQAHQGAILPMMAIKIRGRYSEYILFTGPALSTRG